jgi:hypothetical protein
MTLRPDRTARGAIHDVARLKAMDLGPCYVIAVSEPTLNIIQNYAIDEISYLSRFGVDFGGGYYTPVDESHPDYDFVLDTIRRYRLEVNDMTCDLVGAINNLSAVLSAAQSNTCGCEIGSDVETTDGEEGGDLPDPVGGVEYEEADPITDRKCLAANYIHMGIRDCVDELNEKGADDYAFAGLAFVLSVVATVVAGLIFGPFGLLLGAVSGSFLAMATLLFKGSFSLSNLYGIIISDETLDVCALFDATTASGARDAYIAVLVSNGASSLEVEFIGYLLTNNLLNLLFFAWGDSEDAISGTTPVVDCSLCFPECDWDFLGDPPRGGGSMAFGGERTLTSIFRSGTWNLEFGLSDPSCNTNNRLCQIVSVSGWTNQPFVSNDGLCRNDVEGLNEVWVHDDDGRPPPTSEESVNIVRMSSSTEFTANVILPGGDPEPDCE